MGNIVYLFRSRPLCRGSKGLQGHDPLTALERQDLAMLTDPWLQASAYKDEWGPLSRCVCDKGEPAANDGGGPYDPEPLAA